MALIKCKECGKEFSDMAAVCPNCGYSPALEQKKAVEKSLVPEEQRKSKITAGFLCLFLWEFGAHEFYLGNVGSAITWIVVGIIATIVATILPILVFLLLVPIICAVKLWSMPQDKFDLKYNQITSPRGKLGCLFGLLIGIGILVILLLLSAKPLSQKMFEWQKNQILNESYSTQY